MNQNKSQLKSFQESLSFRKGKDELNQIYNLCAVMEICGGYEQLLNLPLPSLELIMKFLEFRSKEESKGMPRIPRGRR